MIGLTPARRGRSVGEEEGGGREKREKREEGKMGDSGRRVRGDGRQREGREEEMEVGRGKGR